MFEIRYAVSLTLNYVGVVQTFYEVIKLDIQMQLMREDRSVNNPVSMKILAGYVFCGFIWIAVSGQYLNGLIFICITAILLFILIGRIERSGRRSDQFYQRLFESVNDAILILKDSRVVECNQKAQEMFGRDKTELIGSNPWDYSAAAPPDGDGIMDKATENYSICLQGSPRQFEWAYLRPDNRTCYSVVNLWAFEIDQDSFVMAVIRDITLQKREKEELDTYKHIVSASNDSMALVGKDYRYRAVSRSYAERWGWKAEDVVGRMVSDIVGPEYFENEIKPRAERCMAGEEVRFHVSGIRRGGRQRYMHIVYSPHFEQTKKGAVSGYVVASRDITEMRQMEIKLRQVYKMEAIGTLAGGIAHDFNNILMVILWQTENALKQTRPGSELHTSLTTNLEAANRAADLVNQILTFSRQSEQEFYPVQIHLIIKEAAKFMRASLPATIDIETRIDSEALVLADPTQIHQVMMNLCANAGHAMKDTGGKLTIALEDVDLDTDFIEYHPRLKPGRHVKLSINDTGVGIPPEIIDRIFDPFFTTKQTGEGTGMGLSVVHGIVESCGGSITVYSEPNQGANFHVYLPIMEKQDTQSEDQPVLIPRGNETVLLVDDEIKLVTTGRQILKKLGYTVVVCTSGIEAYEQFSKNPNRFDLVITDLTMPYMRGDELVYKIRALRSDVPVLVITGLSTQDSLDKLGSEPRIKLIRKPITTREIAIAIRQILDEKAS